MNFKLVTLLCTACIVGVTGKKFPKFESINIDWLWKSVTLTNVFFFLLTNS